MRSEKRLRKRMASHINNLSETFRRLTEVSKSWQSDGSFEHAELLVKVLTSAIQEVEQVQKEVEVLLADTQQENLANFCRWFVSEMKRCLDEMMISAKQEDKEKFLAALEQYSSLKDNKDIPSVRKKGLLHFFRSRKKTVAASLMIILSAIGYAAQQGPHNTFDKPQKHAATYSHVSHDPVEYTSQDSTFITYNDAINANVSVDFSGSGLKSNEQERFFNSLDKTSRVLAEMTPTVDTDTIEVSFKDITAQAQASQDSCIIEFDTQVVRNHLRNNTDFLLEGTMIHELVHVLVPRTEIGADSLRKRVSDYLFLNKIPKDYEHAKRIYSLLTHLNNQNEKLAFEVQKRYLGWIRDSLNTEMIDTQIEYIDRHHYYNIAQNTYNEQYRKDINTEVRDVLLVFKTYISLKYIHETGNRSIGYGTYTEGVIGFMEIQEAMQALPDFWFDSSLESEKNQWGLTDDALEQIDSMFSRKNFSRIFFLILHERVRTR